MGFKIGSLENPFSGKKTEDHRKTDFFMNYCTDLFVHWLCINFVSQTPAISDLKILPLLSRKKIMPFPAPPDPHIQGN